MNPKVSPEAKASLEENDILEPAEDIHACSCPGEGVYIEVLQDGEWKEGVAGVNCDNNGAQAWIVRKDGSEKVISLFDLPLCGGCEESSPQSTGARVNPIPTRERREYDFRYNGDIFLDEKYVGAIDMYGEIWLKDGILEELPFDDYPPVEEDIRKELRRQMIEEVPPEDWVSEWIKCVGKETLPQNLVRIYEDKWGIGPQSTGARVEPEGNYWWTDPTTGRLSYIVQEEPEGFWIELQDGRVAWYDPETDTFKTEDGWESPYTNDVPQMFIWPDDPRSPFYVKSPQSTGARVEPTRERRRIRDPYSRYR